MIEVDHPATQRWKCCRLAQLGIATPDHLSFVECDFAKTSVSTALRGTPFRADAPAAVSWMGVVYYLEEATVRRALAELAALLAPGSAVVLDYQLPLDVLPQRYRDVHAQAAQHLKQAGEPQVTRHLPEALRADLFAAGFARADLPSLDELYARYAALGAVRPTAERFGLAVAWR